MTELEFKQWIFDPMRLELSPQALLLLLYIKMQNRQRYVFSAEGMTRAMRFKDVRTMRRYKAELLDKGLIRQERCQYGLHITIPALDSDSTFYAPSENSDSTFCADQIVHSVQSDSTFCAPSDSTFHAPLSINNKETNKETNKGDTSEKKFAASQTGDFSPSRDFLSQKKKAAKHSDLPKVSEMDEEKQKMISDLMTRFAQ